jgi:hypothetical protein
MICGDDGEMIYTDDGGVSWTTSIVTTTVALFRLAHPAAGEYAAVGEEGVIMRTSDNGQTWVREISHAMYTCYGADAHGGTVYTVGDFGLALRNTTYPYPIELRSFTAQRDGECIFLSWDTEHEDAHLGSILQHSVFGNWQDGRFFPSRGTDGGRYEWRDCEAGVRVVRYRLKSIGLAGDISFSPEIEVAAAREPSTLSIEVWPQPSQGDVRLRARTEEADAVLLAVDALGRTIYRTHLSGEGYTVSVVIPARAFFSAGVYTLILQGKRSITIRHITVLK